MNFKNKIILAPMADITQMPFRLLCKRFGANIVITEMISANALARKNKRTLELCKTSNDEKPIGIQLFGANTTNIIKAIKIIKENFDFIDLNLGCPAAKIIKQGAGSYLLNRSKKIDDILSKITKLDIPITIKIRAGFKRINFLDIGKIAEKNNIAAITLHARLQEQHYSGNANWLYIKELKENISIPVIGNGDVFSPEDYIKMKKTTKCDSVMVGRGALGNPFIFKQIRDYIKTKKYSLPSKEEKINTYLEIFDDLDLQHAKMQAIYFTKGIKNIKYLREKIMMVKTKKEIKDLINCLFF